MRRVISVTRRHIRFLFERAETMYAPTELPLDIGEGDWQLPPDDNRVGEDIE